MSDEIQQQLYKGASINLCSNLGGQIVMALVMNPPKVRRVPPVALRGICAPVPPLQTADVTATWHAMSIAIRHAALAATELHGMPTAELRCCSLHQPGEESFELYEKERDRVLGSLKRRAKIMVDALNKLEGISCQPTEGAPPAWLPACLSCRSWSSWHSLPLLHPASKQSVCSWRCVMNDSIFQKFKAAFAIAQARCTCSRSCCCPKRRLRQPRTRASRPTSCTAAPCSRRRYTLRSRRHSAR